MIVYLLKFVLCSGLLLLVYKVFLGTENLYKFNRFYLLFSLAFSLLAPAIAIHVPYVKMPVWDSFFAGKTRAIHQQTITQPGIPSNMPLKTEGQLQHQTANLAIDIQDNGLNEQLINQPAYAPVTNIPGQGKLSPATKKEHHYLPGILLALYGAGVLLLFGRFMRNAYRIARLISKSTVINYLDTKLVLVTDDVTPHSFLKYVFLNKNDYYSETIEPEIICHEQTHVKQLHSLDVIGIELLQIVCWFNPFIPIYRKAIQLNHEFLADEVVLEHYQDTVAYQYLLLAKASQCGSLYLTSQFNYQITKKRLIMMTKTTTAAIALYKRLALLPVLAVVLFLFSQKIMAQNASKTQQNGKEIAKKATPESSLNEYSKILAKYHIPYQKGEKINYTPVFSAADEQRLTVLYKQMSAKQQQQQCVRLVPVMDRVVFPINDTDLVNWQDGTKYRVSIDGIRVKNADLSARKASQFYTYSFKQLMPPDAKAEIKLISRSEYNDRERSKKEHFIYIPQWKYVNQPIPGAVPAGTKAQITFGKKMPAYAVQDAPQSILNEYALIGKKYCFYSRAENQKLVKIVMVNISDEDRKRLIGLYEQMSKGQQQKQLLKFIAMISPTPKITPTDHDFNNWKNPDEYGVWINDKKVKNEELDKYKSTDFDHFTVSFLYPAARVHVKYHYQVNLMTKAYYAQYHMEEVAKAKKDKYYLKADFNNFLPEINAGTRSVAQTKDTIAKKTNKQPLIVFDNVPYDKPLPDDFYSGDLDSKIARLIPIQPSQIKGVVILKDEAATKAWGDRGANGVIVISTNREMKKNADSN